MAVEFQVCESEGREHLFIEVCEGGDDGFGMEVRVRRISCGI